MNFQGKIIILGAGAVVENYYLPALYSMGRLSQAWVVDPASHLREKISAKFPEVQFACQDYESFLSSYTKNAQDFVVVALPNFLHEKAVRTALELGFDVLCEKPLSLKKQVCLDLHQLAAQKKQILSVAMVRRLIPGIRALIGNAQGRVFGKIQSLDISIGSPYQWSSDSGSFFSPENGGVLADIGTHYLDIAEQLLGKLRPVQYEDDYQGGVESHCTFLLENASKIPAKLTLSRRQKLRNTIQVNVDQGVFEFDIEQFISCRYRAHDASDYHAEFFCENNFPQVGSWRPVFESCFGEQLQIFINAVTQDRRPPVSAQEIADGAGLIEWAYQHRTNSAASASVSNASARPRLAPKPTLVTGATGFIGGHLISRLCEMGFQDVSAPVRNYQTCAGVARYAVKMPRMNILNYENVKQVLKSSQYVFHLAYGRDSSRESAVTVLGTKNIVNAAIENGAEMVVVLSSMAVFGYPPGIVVDENSPYCPENEYARSKVEMEQWCLQRAKTSGPTKIAILNPSCVYGPLGTTFSRMPLDMAEKQTFCWIEEGKGFANYNYISNLIDAIVLAASLPDRSHGERFIVNDGTISWKEFFMPLLLEWGDQVPSYSKSDLENLEKKNHVSMGMRDILLHVARDRELRRKILMLPGMPGLKQIVRKLKFLKSLRSENNTGPLSLVEKPSSSQGIPPVWLADLFPPVTTRFSSEKAERVLGWKPRILLEEGVQATVEWLHSFKSVTQSKLTSTRKGAWPWSK